MGRDVDLVGLGENLVGLTGDLVGLTRDVVGLDKRSGDDSSIFEGGIMIFYLDQNSYPSTRLLLMYATAEWYY